MRFTIFFVVIFNAAIMNENTPQHSHEMYVYHLLVGLLPKDIKITSSESAIFTRPLLTNVIVFNFNFTTNAAHTIDHITS